ncbi:MAG: nitroreductase family protein [Acidimicrobiia bacterium]|nr:nitroreductase family protein [Acidimicrobiia bacterium]
MNTRYEHPYPSPDVEARYPFESLDFARLPLDESRSRAMSFHDEMVRRRSVRMLSDEPVPRDLIELAVRTASTAPSGAHQQPWRFVATADPDVKRQIREAAEAEERINYEDGRMNAEWQGELARLGTDWHKEFLEIAPWIVVLFEERYGIDDDGSRRHHYYVKESVGIAAGMFITALHHMGLVTLTHTPSPMAFLRTLFGRPENERPFVLFPVGYPVADCKVPTLERKPLEDVLTVIQSDSG